MFQTHVSNRSDDCTQDAHNAVPPNRDAVAGSSMRTWKYLRCIRIQRTIIDVQAEVDDAREHDILNVSPHLRVCEEERHGYQRANNHGVLSAKTGVTQIASNYWTPDSAEIHERIIAPGYVLGGLTESGATTGEISWEEDIVTGRNISTHRTSVVSGTYRG